MCIILVPEMAAGQTLLVIMPEIAPIGKDSLSSEWACLAPGPVPLSLAGALCLCLCLCLSPTRWPFPHFLTQMLCSRLCVATSVQLDQKLVGIVRSFACLCFNKPKTADDRLTAHNALRCPHTQCLFCIRVQCAERSKIKQQEVLQKLQNRARNWEIRNM